MREPKPNVSREERLLGVERTRIGVEGELTYKVGTLIDLLTFQDDIVQKDRILEFSDLDASLLPDEFKVKKVDSVTVKLGTFLVPLDYEELDKGQEADVQREPERSITIHVRAGNETLVIHRSTDPNTDPDDVHDLIEISAPVGTTPDTLVLSEDVSQAKLNRILVGLVKGSATSGDLLAGVNFIHRDFYDAIADILEAEAPLKGHSGIHMFGDGDDELEFTKVEDVEVFKITHTDHTGDTPRDIAAASASSFHLYTRFLQRIGLDVQERFLPPIEDMELLIHRIDLEIDRLITTMRAANAPLDKNATEEDEVVNDAEQRIFNRRAAQISLEEGLREVLGQDGLDSSDTGA